MVCGDIEELKTNEASAPVYWTVWTPWTPVYVYTHKLYQEHVYTWSFMLLIHQLIMLQRRNA